MFSAHFPGTSYISNYPYSSFCQCDCKGFTKSSTSIDNINLQLYLPKIIDLVEKLKGITDNLVKLSSQTSGTI